MTTRDRNIDPIFEEALQWFVRLRDDKAEPDIQARFEAWRGIDRRHAEAFAKAEALWAGLEIAESSYEQHRRRRIDRRGVLALSGILLLGGPAAFWASSPFRFADYRTDIAERRTLVLADGSAIEVGSYSALSVGFAPDRRDIVLHRGQAFFRVAPDASRPFVVRAGLGSVRALGTAFDLKLGDEGTTVSVLEHAVEIATASRDGVVVEEGWQANYGLEGITRPQRFDAGVVEAWRRDRIVFEDVPLRRVLAELERYRRGPIVLMGEAAGDIPVTAVFATGETDQALRTIERTIPVRILRASGYATLVYAR